MFLTYISVAVLSAFLFALLEIQIEGKNGWAGALPTWKLHFNWLKYFPGFDRPITGYHLYLWLFLFVYPHIAFVLTNWTAAKELTLLSFILLVTLIEDFLWFVLNPHFGIHKFNAKYVSWHKPWLGPMPLSYYLGFIVWLILVESIF